MKLKAALLMTLLSMGIHLYLTNHFHQVQMGTNIEKSSCNISSTFNCDSVAASEFSSVFDIPISSFGLSTHLVLFILLLMVVLKLTEIPHKIIRAAFWLSSFSLIASVIMGIISLTQLSTYCLYCIGLYILSLVIFILLKLEASSTKTNVSFKELTNDFQGYIKAPLWPAVMLLSIPLLALFGHNIIKSNHLDGSSKDFQRMVKTSITDWKNAKEVDFEGVQPSFTKGTVNQSAKIVIAEFADFRCGHCKRASGPLAIFAESNPDVQLQFYNFPLDGACNDEISQSNGVSCRLAKSVHCAADQKLAKIFHDKIFEFQNDFFKVSSSDGVDNKLKALLKTSSTDWSKLKSCMDSAQTHAAIKKQAALGKKIGVKGTPKIYLNNKPLPGGFFMPILKEARKIIINQK